MNKSVINDSKVYKAAQMMGLRLLENEKTTGEAHFRRKSRNPIWDI